MKNKADSLEFLQCPNCREVFQSYKLIVSKSWLDNEEEKRNRCSCCGLMYVNMNYVKLLQHITPKEKLKASDFKKPLCLRIDMVAVVPFVRVVSLNYKLIGIMIYGKE